MNATSISMEGLTRKLFAIEAAQSGLSACSFEVMHRVCEKLKQPITRFAGPVGYTSLISRALALAKNNYPQLKPIVVNGEGTLAGAFNLEDSESDTEYPGMSLVGELLGLLVVFVGSSLTVTLVQDAWPEESFTNSERTTKAEQ